MNKNLSIDYINFLTVVAISFISLISLYSISYGIEGVLPYFKKQFTFFLLGIFVYYFFAKIPIKLSYNYIYFIYILIIISLIFVMIFGNYVNGSRRWFLLGPLKFQPSEPAKFITIVTLARYLSDVTTDLRRFKHLLIAVLIIVVPFVLINRQPDLGTSLTFVVIAFPMLFWGGMPGFYAFAVISVGIVTVSAFNTFYFFIALILFLIFLSFFRESTFLKVLLISFYILGGFSAPYIWNNVLKPHQRSRLMTLVNPKDTKGSGYQVTQARIAIGSGGDFGKGFQQGTQVQLKLVPEVHTDMIVCIVGEEFGFLGIVILIGLFGFLIIRLIFYAALTKSKYSGTILVGIATLLFYHVYTNMGMAIGIMPVTGLPLPFLSYGGSALVTNMMMLGFAGNIIENRFEV
jgi:rod shape determining protein RodA